MVRQARREMQKFLRADFAEKLRLTIVEIKDSIQHKIAQRTGNRKISGGKLIYG